MPSESIQPSELHAFKIAEVEAAIAGTQFAGALNYFASTPSTNDLAHTAARAGASRSAWIAGEQTAGRGRGSHTWHSTPGDGLYMTALVSPTIPLESALRLSLRVAIAVQSAIATVFGFRIRDEIDIRWPNDLLLNGRKVGGILIDTTSNPATPQLPATLRHAIIGIGINVNHVTFPPDLEAIATSLRRELAAPAPPKASASAYPNPSASRYAKPSGLALSPSAKDPGFSRWGSASPAACRREPLAAAILIALDHEIRALSNPQTQNLNLYSSWIQGRRVRVEERDGLPGYTGVTAGLDPNGFLQVAGDDGQIHTVLSGGLRDP